MARLELLESKAPQGLLVRLELLALMGRQGQRELTEPQARLG